MAPCPESQENKTAGPDLSRTDAAHNGVEVPPVPPACGFGSGARGTSIFRFRAMSFYVAFFRPKESF
jgi:hypothetical protein